ncbi:leucyl/phenylalanyl-tRNA--protein transferase [Planktotalea sp.]|uniref:leucyl/phenylalanyl-tRNA--protein transferase n=1 Tax=Planktotalea sp. TaxID=2029877 RepID=UPI003D6BC977
MRDDAPPLTPQLLLHAYQAGVFPMADSRDDPEVFWVDPRLRGILPLGEFHVSRSLRRRMRNVSWTVTHNKNFEGIVDGCADRTDTWISHDIARLYSALHRMGHAHSLELWEDDQLVGGVYGVASGTAFFGESMFSRRKDASKVALAYLTTHLSKCGFTLFDTQFLTDHLASLGAIEVSRQHYHLLLHDALQSSANFNDYPPATLQEVLQRKTQTS